ncbi:MAG TPA: glycosyltransferase family 2 protein [Propionibacteriaceae bacterium]|nr:glycosyltransferase family 2 protein [Propionibacteriaceae bacterium]
MRNNSRLENGSERRRHDGTPSVKVSLIIPTLEEAENLKFVLPAIPDIVDELIIVDGGSKDSTVDVVRELQPDAKIIIDTVPGKGNALRRGFEAATGDILVMMDADGSMDPLDIVTFVVALEAGADVAKGSRFLQGGGSADMTLVRRLGNRALTRAVRLAFGGRYSDLCYGYMAFWRHVLPTFEGDAQGFEVETFLNVRTLAAGLRVVEVASFEGPRLYGESHLRTFRDGSRALLTIGRERRRLSQARAERGVPRPDWRDVVPVKPSPELPAPVADIFPTTPTHLANEA